MTLNAELTPISIEHRLHRIHYQHQQYQYHQHQHQHQHHHYHVHNLTHLNNSFTKSNHQNPRGSNSNHLLHKHQQQKSVTTSRRLTHVVSPHQREQTAGDRQTIRSTQSSQIRFFIFAAIAYILSPIDLIPEVIFGVFGILDDIIFLLMCMFCIAIVLLYPIFRRVQQTMVDKLHLKALISASNKRF